MSNTETEINENDVLTAEVVADYLQNHPDFFMNRPALVDRLALPHQQLGAVSLVHVQLNRQRHRIEELEEEITALMSLAASNDRTLHAFMDLQEQMFRCDDLSQVIEAIERKAEQLSLKAHIRLSGAPTQYALDAAYWQRFTTNNFNGNLAYLGRMRKADRDGLFGEHSGAPEFGSYVVMAVRGKDTHGILAFSSEDGGHFQPSMDTLFLRYLAEVLTHLLHVLPWKRV
ncbi:hypothetical protein VR7878_01695 [Vibrio ruber DSM 16370]|uniref:3',5'-cyclic-nucleotide phosphodiesterase n=1 Tax=Vibrio ruber (strain DSM 16370 / JCM 11486 / BCRC 17186 / CECT 7878 / LMG 23124 / VR1) TaxID=1123498 RepID=A0A1R4LI69_VIBR1|nr:DUF484 family protein [Vibrio ruber]SJN56282.1 hypothetical protein VR7878_01695 [Vibrio ruber DSM 16370]